MNKNLDDNNDDLDLNLESILLNPEIRKKYIRETKDSEI